jgi:hypothetical protein
MLALLDLVVVVLLIRYYVSFLKGYLSGQPHISYTNEVGEQRTISAFTGIGRGIWYLICGPELLRKRYTEVSPITQSSYRDTNKLRHKENALSLQLHRTTTSW